MYMTNLYIETRRSAYRRRSTKRGKKSESENAIHNIVVQEWIEKADREQSRVLLENMLSDYFEDAMNRCLDEMVQCIMQEIVKKGMKNSKE